MFDSLRGWLLRILRVPPQPANPPGSHEARVFRAAPNYYRYKVALWALAQLGAFAGLVTGLFFLVSVFRDVDAPGIVVTLTRVAEIGAWVFYFVQLPVSFALLRLDFDLRWYVLTDRSLRIREGIVAVREKTMTFANIQHIAVRQNPLQRLLGISDVEVRSAGGGSGDSGDKKGADKLHIASFRGVDDPELIRRAVLERVRLHRDAGLGDPDDARSLEGAGVDGGTLEAARELHAEIRALRAELAA